jgi:uncharacterized protein YprB with RNaseH-like and TPR domain
MTNLLTRLFCNHRHNIENHPRCFVSGNVNLEQAEALYKENGEPWYKLDGLRIGYLDIESDGLKADFSTMLTWCIKEKDGDVTYDMIKKEELFAGVDPDKRLVKSCIQEMQKYKIIVTYYGTGFDIPFIRSKALHYDLCFPSYTFVEQELKNGNTRVLTLPELYHFDIYYTVKSKLNLSRKSLDSACDYLHIEGKTPLSKEAWRLAKYGNAEALAQVLEHNTMDVAILEKLHNKLEPFQKWGKKSV